MADALELYMFDLVITTGIQERVPVLQVERRAHTTQFVVAEGATPGEASSMFVGGEIPAHYQPEHLGDLWEFLRSNETAHEAVLLGGGAGLGPLTQARAVRLVAQGRPIEEALATAHLLN